MPVVCLVEQEYIQIIEMRIKEESINEALVFSGMLSCHWYSFTNLQLPDFGKGALLRLIASLYDICMLTIYLKANGFR